MAHERITRMIVERYRAHSSECRRIWRLRGDGPQLHVDVTDEDEAEFSLRGRSRTLANRQFRWKHDGGDGTMAELLGATGSGKPLDAQLANVAMVQAVRAAVAADMGTGTASLPADRILIDRFVASTLMAKNGGGILGRIARAARKADGDEIMPNSQMTMTNAGSLQFGVSPVEVDLPDDKVRPPQVRMTSVTLARTVTYIHSRLQIDGGTLPETLAIAATGRPLRDVIDTGSGMLANRTIEGVTKVGETIILRLAEDMAEIRDILGRK